MLTLFFCGWGMDEHTVQHVRGMGDLLLFYDYRDISGEDAPEVEGYESVRVVAWSMGVWAASVLLSRWNIPVSCRVAINGTERPVDEHYGIHPKIYLLTERGRPNKEETSSLPVCFPGRKKWNVSRKTGLAGLLMSKGTNCDLSGSSRHGKCPKCTGSGFMFPRGMLSSRWKINETGGGIVSRLLRYRGDITRFTC